MISAGIESCACSMAKAVMNVQKVSAVVKAIDFASFFIVCEFCAVIAVSQGQTVSFHIPAELCDSFYTIRAGSIIFVIDTVSVNIRQGSKHMIFIICIIYSFIVNINDFYQISIVVPEQLLFSGR